ncbi:hypothetical protein [Aurantiacibacter gangjinensis]|nr:hypothetical protein [Aurantiacibacter gangjinensis]APE27765.1 hypothetical protein BMF35_a0936 [Aurantiacibacter gangjinensis]
MKHVLLTIAASCLLGCAPTPTQDNNSAEQANTASADHVSGRYQVFALNEVALTPSANGLPEVTIEDGRLHLQSQCIFHDWEFSRDGETVRTGSWDYGDEAVGMCARGLTETEQTSITVLSEVDRIIRVAGGYYLSGPAGNIQLQTIPDPAEVAARDVDLRGHWSVRSLDGADLPYSIELQANFDEIWWNPGCAGQGRQYAIDGSAFSTVPPPDGAREVCAIGYPEELPRIWQVMDQAETIVSRRDGVVVISGPDGTVGLVPAPAPIQD